MNELIIEKGISIPKGWQKKDGFSATLRRCEIGDSFIVIVQNSSGFASAATRLKMRVSSRKQPDGTYRVWRVA